MNHTRCRVRWWPVFLGLCVFLWAAERGSAQSASGWGNIWQERLTIGQAELDDAFKLAEQGKTKEALATIDEVIARDPANWRPYFLKAAVLVLAKRGDDAIRVIDTSIGLARRSNISPALLAELYESKARSCLDYGRPGEARQSLEAALHLQPNDPTTLNDLAWLLATTKEPQLRNGRRAYDLAMKACKLGNWKNAFTIDTLAASAAAAGNFQNAVKYQRLAIGLLSLEDRKTQLMGMEDRLHQYLMSSSPR